MIKHNRIKQFLALAIILAVLALSAMIALKAYRGMHTGSLLSKLPKNIDVSLKQIHYSEEKDGKKKWDLLADKAEYDKGGELVHLSLIHLTIPPDGDAGEAVVTSDRADYNTKTRDVELIGNVVAKGASDMEFTTGRISFDNAKGVLRTTDRVKFTKGNLTVDGVGLELVLDRKKAKVLKQVEASYNFEKGKK